MFIQPPSKSFKSSQFLFNTGGLFYQLSPKQKQNKKTQNYLQLKWHQLHYHAVYIMILSVLKIAQKTIFHQNYQSPTFIDYYHHIQNTKHYQNLKSLTYYKTYIIMR